MSVPPATSFVVISVSFRFHVGNQPQQQFPSIASCKPVRNIPGSAVAKRQAYEGAAVSILTIDYVMLRMRRTCKSYSNGEYSMI